MEKLSKMLKKSRYQACNKRSKKELFSVRAKLSYNKKFFQKIYELYKCKKQNKTVYLEISKIVMGEFWYDCVKPKCREKTRLCYMETGSPILYIKAIDIRHCKIY